LTVLDYLSSPLEPSMLQEFHKLAVVCKKFRHVLLTSIAGDKRHPTTREMLAASPKFYLDQTDCTRNLILKFARAAWKKYRPLNQVEFERKMNLAWTAMIAAGYWGKVNTTDVWQLYTACALPGIE
jgi:hypothetical protein